MSDSIFTKIINREIPATIYYEDDHFIAIKDIHPAAPVHALVIPKYPFQTLEEFDLENTEMMGKLLQVARRVAQQLQIVDNYKVVMNVGKDVQAVHHAHVHVMGGWDKPDPQTKVGM